MRNVIKRSWSRDFLLVFGFLAAIISYFSFSLFTSKDSSIQLNSSKQSDILAQFMTMPLYFERNEGQTDEQVRYLTKGIGYTFFFTPQEIVIALSKKKSPISLCIKNAIFGRQCRFFRARFGRTSGEKQLLHWE